MDVRWTAAALLVAAALAGCIGAPGSTTPTGAAAEEIERAIPAVPNVSFASALTDVHPHEIPRLHTSNYNLEKAAYSPGTEGLDPAAYGSGYSEADVQDGWALVSSVEGQRGFTVFNVTADDISVASHVYSGAETWDTRFSDDGNWAFMGCQGGGRYGALLRDSAPGGCTSGATPQAPAQDGYKASGIVAVDVSDPTDPKKVAYTPSKPVHNLYTATIDGTIVVVNHAGQVFTFDPKAEAFSKVATIDATHDVAFQKHPVTGEWLLYTGTSEGGLQIYDFSEPSEPERLSSINEGRLGRKVVGWHEQTPAPTLIDGRHVTVVAGEQSGGLPGPVSVVDTTDPAEPKLLGQWELPGRYTPQESYKFSNHNVDVSASGQVAIGMYHGGVWVFDISTVERMHHPPTLGYYQPHETNPKAGQQPSPYGTFTGSPYVWGAQWTGHGDLLVPDMNSGVYLLEPTWNTTTVDA